MIDWKKIIAFKGDKTMWYMIILLMLVSLMLVYSSTARLAYSKQDGNTFFYLFKQIGLFVGGFGVLFVMQCFSWQWFYRNASLLLWISGGLLLWAAFGGSNINGAGRWIRIPVIGMTFQPSEFAKIALVIYTAKLLSDLQTVRGCSDEILKAFLLPALIIGLIFLDGFSTSALISVVCLVLFMIGRVRWMLLGKVCGTMIVVLGLIVSLGIFVPQVRDMGRIGTIVARITAFVVPGGESQAHKDYNYQSDQAQIAVAKGGIMGCGPGNSDQRNFLPHAYSDFIYAIIIEEYGLIGGFFVLLFYTIILYRSGVIGRKCMKTEHLNPRGGPEIFPTLLVLGLGTSIVLQAMFHMGVNVGALPVTGQTLPLVSLGGTSLWLTCASFGIILGVAHRFSPEGESEDLSFKTGFFKRKERETNYPQEDFDDELLDTFDDELKVDSKPTQGGRRGGRRSMNEVEEEDDFDIIGDMGGFDEEDEDLKEEGREVLNELRRRGRRG